ncbi:TetR family transcriptional regulator [Gordonia jinghuaiqii]|uniref:TetR/AcrR family transcriptional regulator n=1 Tax=Gordonia jinghuaiqii TaxID=2758710 RepID=A0A7D7QVV8_9ACTN|nr:TetR/AcrR family transcriptional regulator [Gordonia jinghuaiqii]MCR5977372.1 TetR family transcriptional regulator [Gordonia jinghuaiqii]QMT00048.1 TetR/AcrR family transcriptional regulator [Gordonia jinghuaiqii]
MPANRRPRARAEKRDEIVTSARRLFVDNGYDDTTLSKIAADARVTANTVYWYFPDKDHLLVAVLEELLIEALARYEPMAQRPLADKIMFVLEELSAMRNLVDTVHSRRAASPIIDRWHSNFHAMADALTRADLPPDDAQPASHIIAFVVEGLLTHPGDEAEQRAIIDLLVDRITQR